jgi:NAD(P)H-hydrate epimerase
MTTTFITLQNTKSLLKPRPKDSHKGSFGTVNAVVGCARYRGAATLSVMGALRSGAGIVRLCSTEKVCSAVTVQYPSATLLPLPETAEGYIAKAAAPAVLSTVKTTDALLLGCGLGQCADTGAAVNLLISTAKCRKVIDADALNLLSATGALPEVKKNGALRGCVITPHVGEISRLTGKSISEISENMESTAQEFVSEYGCVTVLKSHRTVIAVPNEETVYISELGNSGLAKGGSGDVLAGLIAGLLAQGYTAKDSALLGVCIHGFAADLCASERSMQAMLPSDLGEYICRIFKEYENN